MSKKVYIKDESFDPIYKEVSRGFYAKTKVLPTALFFAGMFVFAFQVVLPILVFKTQSKSLLMVDNATIMGRTAGFYDFEFDELKKGGKEVLGDNDSRDEKSDPNVPNYFYLTIPKLKIENAMVETQSQSLNPDQYLGHYPGTSLPGEKGNTFIFGHSVLPWFFNPNNYKTIFSTLGKLEPGDEFTINYNNNELTYVVESVEELDPEKVKPLAEIKPGYLNESTAVLMTCSPPGTKLKRLLVNGVLMD